MGGSGTAFWRGCGQWSVLKDEYDIGIEERLAITREKCKQIIEERIILYVCTYKQYGVIGI